MCDYWNYLSQLNVDGIGKCLACKPSKSLYATHKHSDGTLCYKWPCICKSSTDNCQHWGEHQKNWCSQCKPEITHEHMHTTNGEYFTCLNWPCFCTTTQRRSTKREYEDFS